MPEASVSHHLYPNGLVLVAETMPSVQSAAFSLLLPRRNQVCLLVPRIAIPVRRQHPLLQAPLDA